MPRWKASGVALFGLSSSAASAGDRVSELNVEMMVLAAMVMPNWR